MTGEPRVIKFALCAIVCFLLYFVADVVISALVHSTAGDTSWEAVSAIASLVLALACAGSLIPLSLLSERRSERRAANRPRPDYSLIAAMEREVYGETFEHEGAPEQPPRVVSGRSASAAPNRKCAACGIPQATAYSLYAATDDRFCPACRSELRRVRDKGTRCYCNYCRGRAGVHGAEAIALYRAECEAAMDEHRSNLRWAARSDTPASKRDYSADDEAVIRMLAGATFGPSARVTLPSGRTVTGSEMQRLARQHSVTSDTTEEP